MKNDKYAIFDALNPFFEIVQEGLTGLVDGKHFFDTIAEDAFFDFRYNFPGWPLTIRGRADLMDQFSGYGDTIRLYSADGLVMHRSQDRRVGQAQRRRSVLDLLTLKGANRDGSPTAPKELSGACLTLILGRLGRNIHLIMSRNWGKWQ